MVFPISQPLYCRISGIKKKHCGQRKDGCRNASCDAKDDSRCSHQLDIAPTHTAKKQCGEEKGQGCQNAQQLHWLNEYKACHSNEETDGIGDDPFSDVKDGRRQQQGNKKTALQQERQVSLHS